MNCLYASHIHKDYFVYHAFMHTVKSSCHTSLPEQSGLLRLQEHPMVQPRVSVWRSKFVVSRTSLRFLSFYINKVEVMYRFKQSSMLLCPHTDVLCTNSYKALTTITSFRWISIFSYFAKEYIIILWEFPTQERVKESG